MKNKRPKVPGKSLSLARVSLRRLSAGDLDKVGGGFTDGDDCIATAFCNSKRPWCPAPGSTACPQ
jgi:hypothetical protein